MTMIPTQETVGTDNNQLICWYALTSTGEEIVKMYTYHNFVGGWYMQLSKQWAERVSVTVNRNQCEFSVWNKSGTSSERVVTIYTLSGNNRENQIPAEEYIELYRTDTVVYVAKLEPCAEEYGLDPQTIRDCFRLIQQDWKTGET